MSSSDVTCPECGLVVRVTRGFVGASKNTSVNAISAEFHSVCRHKEKSTSPAECQSLRIEIDRTGA